jgi:hypothetical protein
MWTNAGLELFERRASEGMHSPWLQIPSRRRAGGAIEDVAHR